MTNPTTAPVPSPPRPRGRPALAIGEGRQTSINYRTTAMRAAKLKRIAADAGLSVSAWHERQIDCAVELVKRPVKT